MYADRNFKSKKEFKEAVAGGYKVGVYQPNDMFGTNGGIKNVGEETCCCEGPHYPEPHKWYASVTLKDGIVVKVK